MNTHVTTGRKNWLMVTVVLVVIALIWNSCHSSNEEDAVKDLVANILMFPNDIEFSEIRKIEVINSDAFIVAGEVTYNRGKKDSFTVEVRKLRNGGVQASCVSCPPRIDPKNAEEEEYFLQQYTEYMKRQEKRLGN